MTRCSIRSVLWVFLLLGVAGMSAGAEELRTWRDDTGKFELQATLDRVDGDRVLLKRADGKVLTVPKSRLSKADLEYLAGRNAAPPSPDTATGEKREPGDALVLVTVTVGDKELSTFPAFAILGDGKRTIVGALNLPYRLAEQMPGIAVGTNRSPLVRTPDPVKFTISWGAAEQPKQLEAELVAFLPRRSTLLLAGPAADLPTPLNDPPTPPVREQDRLTVLALESQSGQQASSYARSTLTGTVQKIFRNPQGAVTSVEVTLPMRSRIVTGLVFTADGRPLGTIGPALPPTKPDDKTEEPRYPVAALAPWKQRIVPEVTQAWSFPLRGNREKIEYEFVLDIADPFREMRSPRLLVLNTSAGFIASQSQLARQQAVLSGLLEKGIEAKLLDEQPNEKFRQLAAKAPAAGVKTYVARVQTDNPWNDKGHNFFLQLVYERPDGTTHHLDPTLVHYDPASIRQALREDPQASKRGLELPAIPGLDGSAKDAPAATSHAGGGWLLTSETTRVKTQPRQIARDWGAAVAGGAPVAVAKSKEAEGVKADTLDLKVPRSERKFPTAWLISPDGTHLFVVDNTHKLHRIRLADLTDEVTWNLGVACHSLGWSKAGLLVSAGEGSILVVDPKTLGLVREIPCDRPQVVRGNMTSDIGFSLALPSGSSLGYVEGDQLSMLDLAKGEVLHRISTMYEAAEGRRAALRINNQPISFMNWNLGMTSDGKWLFASGPTNYRFRVEGKDLILDAFEAEANDPAAQLPFGNDFVLSPDGKYIARRQMQSPSGVTICATAEWKAPLVEIPNAELSRIAFEPATSDVYVFGGYSRPELTIYNLKTKDSKTRKVDRDLGGHFIQIARGGKHAVLQSNSGDMTVVALPD